MPEIAVEFLHVGLMRLPMPPTREARKERPPFAPPQENPRVERAGSTGARCDQFVSLLPLRVIVHAYARHDELMQIERSETSCRGLVPPSGRLER